jgi:hypothetical protein
MQVRPATETEAVNATVPANPLTGATVTVEEALVPATITTDVGLALTLKSVTANVTVVAWLNDPLVPVTITV